MSGLTPSQALRPENVSKVLEAQEKRLRLLPEKDRKFAFQKSDEVRVRVYHPGGGVSGMYARSMEPSFTEEIFEIFRRIPGQPRKLARREAGWEAWLANLLLLFLALYLVKALDRFGGELVNQRFYREQLALVRRAAERFLVTE